MYNSQISTIMIKRIFQHKWYLQKHLDAPQLYQREEFLETVKLHFKSKLCSYLKMKKKKRERAF